MIVAVRPQQVAEHTPPAGGPGAHAFVPMTVLMPAAHDNER
jgi:hypothetical protein